MTLPMDIRILAGTARVGFVFARRGIVPDGAASWFLPRIVGISQALEWCLTGRLLPASEALAGGLVRTVCPAAEVLPLATQLAREIAGSAAPVSAVLTRQLLWQMLGADHPMTAHRIDSRAIFDTGRMADAAEGWRRSWRNASRRGRSLQAQTCRRGSPGGPSPHSLRTQGIPRARTHSLRASGRGGFGTRTAQREVVASASGSWLRTRKVPGR
jgi:hypothetical protein